MIIQLYYKLEIKAVHKKDREVNSLSDTIYIDLAIDKKDQVSSKNHFANPNKDR